MSCKHEHLRTVGNRLFCKDCKEELPIEFLTASSGPEKAQERPAEKKTGKAPAKKKTAKSAD